MMLAYIPQESQKPSSSYHSSCHSKLLLKHTASLYLSGPLHTHSLSRMHSPFPQTPLGVIPSGSSSVQLSLILWQGETSHFQSGSFCTLVSCDEIIQQA